MKRILRRALTIASATLAAALSASVATGAVTLSPVGTFDQPVFVTAPPGDTQRVFVVEQPGTVQLLVDGVRQPQPYLDIRSFVEAGGERGLLSMAFAPDFAFSRRFYVYYTGKTPYAPAVGDIVIDEYQAASPTALTVDAATRRRVLTVPHPGASNHNGGQLAFGPDSMLYIATGDGGGGGDPDDNGQRLTSLLGKMLRIDPRPGAATIPPDNPYAGGLGGAREIWSYGLRNPFRFSFDRQTGDLAIGDVGQDFVEEVDFVTKAGGLGRGGNYGWDLYEGRYTHPGGQLATAFPPSNILPVLEQFHSNGWCSVTGGYVVRDPQLPTLLGRYVYSDYCKGEIRSAVLASPLATGDGPTGLSVSQISSFGEDGCGRLYVASLGGAVRRFTEGGACAGPAPTPFPIPTGPGGTDTTSPGVRATANLRQKIGKAQVVRVRVTCNERCLVRVTGRVTIRRGKRVSTVFLVPVVRRLGVNAPAVMTLAVPRRARSAVRTALAQGRVVSATVTILARDDAQNRTVRRKAIRMMLG